MSDVILTRFALILGLLVFATGSFAAEPAPAPRPTYPRFDLTYYPEIEGQGLVGVRPVEIARRAKGTELAAATTLFKALFTQALVSANLEAAEPPAFAEIEQCVLTLGLHVTTPTADEKGTFYLGGSTPCAVRTVHSFDWDGLIHKWFPKADRKSHAGRSYWRAKVEVGASFLTPGSPTNPVIGFFIPDDRTLICGDADDIQAVLVRLAAGGPSPTAPPGWDQVDRAFAALVLDLREEKPLSGRFPPTYPWGKDVMKLMGACKTVALGVTVEERTTLRVVGTTWEPSDTRVALRAVRRLLKAGTEKLNAEEPGGLNEFALQLLSEAKITSGEHGFNLTMTSDRNALELLESLLHGAD